MSKNQPILHWVRKDHTCISIGLGGFDFSHMCDKCRYFQRRVDVLCSCCLGNFQIEKYEKPWILSNGIKKTPYRLIEKNRKAIEILQSYNYKVVDDVCDKKV